MLYNRDLSWLTFNDRVLLEAADPKVPLYERLKFLAIYSSNLDEFFRVRYPSVIALSKLNKKLLKEAVLLSEEDVANKVQAYINSQLQRFGNILHHEILPELLQHNIAFHYNAPVNEENLLQIREIFFSKVLSFIQPVFLNPEGTKNFVPENSHLYFVVTLHDESKDTINHVIVNIPSKKLKRFFVLKPLHGVQQVYFIDDVIRENMPRLFPGSNVLNVFSIKFNRDAALALNDDYSDNLLDKIEKKLSKRELGAPTRFLFEAGMPTSLQLYLSGIFKIDANDMFEGGRYHNLSDLMSFPSFDKSLHYPDEHPLMYPPNATEGDLFNLIAAGDILLHLPYHSYSPVLSFFNQAAVDANVSEIYVTLYRVASESHIVNALISAAKNGKKVTAFIELKARFDEANNIKWSRTMKDAGIRLIYSDPAIKVHSKIALVRTVKGDHNYAILSTGNFNETTASFYTDHVLFTANQAVCKEMYALFGILQRKKLALTNATPNFKKLLVSQFNLLPEFERLIALEIEKVKNGQAGLIRIKVNNLEEPYFINLLYQASAAGVEVQLIVRSICCLIPQKADLSEHIVVKRIIDKYLEHTRLFIFGEDADAVVCMGSSDLMTRNLRRRIEVCIAVNDEFCRKQLLDYFGLQWQDNAKATLLRNDMEQHRVPQLTEEIHRAQSDIFQYLQTPVHGI